MTDSSRAGNAGQLPLALPANVRAGQVISLVEITGGLGARIDASRLADELGADIAVLIPILDTAEMLGLVKSERGEVSLTDFGHKFQKTAKNKVRLLKDRLADIEPFRTALDLTSRKKDTSAEEIAEALSERGIRWHYNTELNESLVNALLIHWAIYAGLLNYDGKKGKFQRA